MVEGLFLKAHGEKHLVYRNNIAVPRWLEEPEHAISEGSLAGRQIADFGRRKRYFFNDHFHISDVDVRESLSDIIYKIHVKAPNKDILNYGDIIQPRQVVTTKSIPIKVANFR